MTQGYYQHMALTGRIQATPRNSLPSLRSLDALETENKESFKDTINNLARGIDKEMNAPGQLLTGVLQGNTDIDIHDVMTAMAKAEMSVSVATQITSKVIQAYDKIMQISV